MHATDLSRREARAAAIAVDPGIAAKVDFLSRPAAYPGTPPRVERIETHHSWVFLAGDRAYKLKKPIRLDHRQLASAPARRFHCLREIRLNRRLTEGVYLRVLPLALEDGGRLRLGGAGVAVDWLIEMRRLRASRMLDRMIRDDTVRREDISALVGLLGAVYRTSAPAIASGALFRERFARGIAENARELRDPRAALPAELLARVDSGLHVALARHAALVDRRVDDGRIVEGHGDLRAEHVCLEERPQIIDCLAFSRSLRIVDAAEELGFLALECERLGAPRLKYQIFDAYRDFSGDAPPPALVDFYQAYHACVRAKLAVWHLRDPAPARAPRWANRALTYLRLAQFHLAQ